MTSYKKYPPKNRSLVQPLAAGAAQLHDAAGWHDTTLNELNMQAIQESLILGAPVVTSELSSEPGYYFRDAEVCLALTLDELSRMLRHNLDKEEYFRLRDTYGMFRHIEPMHYDNTTGRALMPLITPAEHNTFMAQCLVGRVEPSAIDDFVEQWHQKRTTGIPLHRFLGMRRDEYARWLQDSRAIYEILFYRLRSRTSMQLSDG